MKIYFDYSDYPSIDNIEVAIAREEMVDIIECIDKDAKVKTSKKGYEFGSGEIKIKNTTKKKKKFIKELNKEIPSWTFEK